MSTVVNYLCQRGWHALCGVAPADCSCECHGGAS